MSVDKDSSHDAEPVCGNPVVALVVRARDGDERAWAALVERYAPLIWSLTFFAEHLQQFGRMELLV